jgi:hypothetical protein
MRIGMQLKMPDPDPYQINADPKNGNPAAHQEEERRRKEEKEEEARRRREELIKKKAEEQREKREERIRRVQETVYLSALSVAWGGDFL